MTTYSCTLVFPFVRTTKFLKEVDARSEKMVTYVNNSISKSLNFTVLIVFILFSLII